MLVSQARSGGVAVARAAEGRRLVECRVRRSTQSAQDRVRRRTRRVVEPDDGSGLEAVGSELVANFVAMKREEWRRFSQAVTDWELNEYLAFH